jgi:hypothetical protein
MDDDFAVWHSARFGEPADLDIRVGSDLATALFNVSFSRGDGPQLRVRLSTTWRRRKGQWFLTQSSNTVPTVGSSARDLLKH